MLLIEAQMKKLIFGLLIGGFVMAEAAALDAAEATLQSSPKALTLRAEKTLLAQAEPKSKIMLKAC